MNQKRNIIVIIVAAAMLVGLVILAVNLDGGRNNPGTSTTEGQSQSAASSEAGKDKWTVTYEEYNAMSGAEQEAFYHSFDSADDYFKWYKAAKKTYEDNRNDIVIGGDGSIDLGDILNKK